MIDTEDKRRSVGEHMCLTVLPTPNAGGVQSLDKPHICWVYREVETFATITALCGYASLYELLYAVGSTPEAMVAVVACLDASRGVASTFEADMMVDVSFTVLIALPGQFETEQAIASVFDVAAMANMLEVEIGVASEWESLTAVGSVLSATATGSIFEAWAAATEIIKC